VILVRSQARQPVKSAGILVAQFRNLIVRLDRIAGTRVGLHNGCINAILIHASDQIAFFIVKPKHMTFTQMSMSINYFCHIRSYRLLGFDGLFSTLNHFQ
jgi:hypothetical protein